MGNNCNYCTCCKETNHSKSSEDFEIKKIDEFGKASDAKNNSCKSLSIENLSQLKAEIVISANTSLIDFYSNSLETPEKEYSDNKNLIKRGVSLNTINEKTDSDLNEYLNSKLFICFNPVLKSEFTEEFIRPSKFFSITRVKP